MAVRKAAFLTMCLFLLLSIGQAAGAEKNCCVSLTFSYRGTAVSGGSITLYCVTGLVAENSSETAQALAAHTAGFTGETKSIEQGTVSFDGLAPGLYLVVQDENIPGFLSISPFLVTLPLERDGTFLYCLSAAPKLAPCSPSPETGQSRWPFILLWVSGIGLSLASSAHFIAFHAKNRLRF